jgi:hypothetical protein
MAKNSNSVPKVQQPIPFYNGNAQMKLARSQHMVIIDFHSKNSKSQYSSNEQLSIAKKRLEGFPILNEIFNKFDPYQRLHYKERQNKVFITCCPRPNGRYEIGYPKLLEALEDSLKIFDIHSWQRSLYKEFTNRLTSSDYYKSEGAILEILAAYDIGKNIALVNYLSIQS